jgi:bifunctional DNA-binding transcriptional regulator/antitoxin component of YhaV-PrlF toxin-antitoxin module
MQSVVTAKNQVSIPAAIARRHGIRPGYRIEWLETDRSDVLEARVLPDPRAIAEELYGAGRQFLAAGADPVADLVNARLAEDDG